MSEAVQIALCVAGTAILTQIIVSWLQPHIKSRIKHKNEKRIKVQNCFSEFFGLLGATPSWGSINNHPKQDIDYKIKKEANEWFFKFNKLLWEIKTYISKDKELIISLDKLTNNIADIYDLQTKLFTLNITSDNNDIDIIIKNINEKEKKQEILSETFSLLAIKYLNKL